VTLCIVTKRCVLEQKLLLATYMKSYVRNPLVPKWMTLFRGRIKVMSTIALRSTLNISETVRDRGLVQKGQSPIGNGIWGIKWSRDRWHHVTPNVLWSSMVGYPSDSLASCTGFVSFGDFYRATAYVQSALGYYAIPVRPSRAWISQTRFKVGLCNLHRTIAHPSN